MVIKGIKVTFMKIRQPSWINNRCGFHCILMILYYLVMVIKGIKVTFMKIRQPRWINSHCPASNEALRLISIGNFTPFRPILIRGTFSNFDQRNFLQFWSEELSNPFSLAGTFYLWSTWSSRSDKKIFNFDLKLFTHIKTNARTQKCKNYDNLQMTPRTNKRLLKQTLVDCSLCCWVTQVEYLVIAWINRKPA